MKQCLEQPRTSPRAHSRGWAGSRITAMILLALFCAATSGTCLAAKTKTTQPTAFDLSVVVAANFSNPIVLQGTDPNGLPLSFSILSPPSNGHVNVRSGPMPTVFYTPNPNYLGPDSFIYVVCNGEICSDARKVSITVKRGLLINNISVAEGNSGTKSATFTVTDTFPGGELDLVLVSYQTANGTAVAGSDYVATSGTLVFGQNSAQTVTVLVNGDQTTEFNESFLVTLSNPSASAVIVSGTGRGTILDDDTSRIVIGTAALTPEDSVVGVGELINMSLTWTHPVGWRQLDSVDLLIVDDQGAVLNTRWNETANTFSLFLPAADGFVRTADALSSERFETSGATLYLQDCTGGGPPGQTATIDFSLSFKPEAAGRTFSVEAFATDDAGDQQGFESVGTITVLPH
jgi:hypothetical protein